MKILFGGKNKQKHSIFVQLQITTIMNYRLFSSNIKKTAVLSAILCTLFIASIVSAQDTITVSGKVVNGINEPVSGVSIGIEGSFELPVVTNDEGEFVLKVLDGSIWLNIEPSGNYKNKRIFLDNREKLKIYLVSNDIESGYDEIKMLSQNFLKRDIAASASTLNADNIIYTPSLSVDEYLQGKVSGMNVINRSGLPGSGAVTFIRGSKSLITDSRPLYVIDGLPLTDRGVFASNLEGFEYNWLLSINPLDISNITVVKDATFAPAFGSKASNGIVFIETLDPSATQTVIELDLRTGYSLAPDNQIPQLNALQHKTLVSELLFSTGMQEEEISEQYPNLFLDPEDDRYINYQHNTNWQDIIFSDAVMNNVNIKVKGGDEIARYGLSFGYMNADGIINSTGYDGYNLRFVSLLNIFTWLKMNAGVSLNYSNANLKESGKVSQTSPILTGLFKSPMLYKYQYDLETGQELPILADVDELGVSNPLAVIENYEATNSNFNFTSSLGFIAEINSNLNFHTDFGLNYNIFKESIFMPNRGMELYDDGEAHNVSKSTNNTFTSLYFNNYLSFNKKINSASSFSSVTGIHTMNSKYELDWALARNSHENDEYRLLHQGTGGLWAIGGANRIWNWVSVYEKLSYSLMDKYLATASISLDGSSRIGENAANTTKIGGLPFGLFYSIGAGWRISNEGFLKDWSKLEELKLRLSYGRSGNDNIGESTATSYYNIVKFRSTSGLYPALLANDELTYEMVSQLNAGIDISLFGDRLTAKLDIYKSQTDNLLIYAPLESYFGYDFRPENNGKLENKGIELDVFLRVIDRKFKWDIEAMYSQNKNKLLDIKGDQIVTEVLGGEVVNKEGEQANSFYGYIFEGVYATTQEANDKGYVNERLQAYQAGDAIYRDISGPNGTPDNIINDYDKTIIGSSMPEHFGGLSNTITYKKWSLNTFLQYVKGNEVFNYVRYQNENMVGLENQSATVLNRWQYEGQITEVPRALYGDIVGNSAFSTRWIEDGSYLRVKSISLSYTIPGEFLSFRNAKFYASATNLFTFSKYLGYDPEFAHSSEHVSQGIDYGMTPQPRQFILGVKLGL